MESSTMTISSLITPGNNKRFKKLSDMLYRGLFYVNFEKLIRESRWIPVFSSKK